MRKESLIWSPANKALEERLAGDSLIVLISPFIGLEALRKLLQDRCRWPDLKVLVRWRAEDIRTGVTDIAIYPFLAEYKVPLYMNSDIHLKLYIFESNVALNTSANLTLRGLGYSEKPNIEVGHFVTLGDGDWLRLYGLFEKSRRVDESIYAALKEYREKCARIQQPPYPDLVLPSSPRQYSLSSLPSVESPSRFIDMYSTEHAQSQDELRRFVHDTTLFGIQDGLGCCELESALRHAFRSSSFVRDFVAFLRQESELRFGSVASWIHTRCEDVPLPYRWEVKESTRILYNWLEFFFEEIRWDTPHYSQIIHWTEKNTSEMK